MGDGPGSSSAAERSREAQPKPECEPGADHTAGSRSGVARWRGGC